MNFEFLNCQKNTNLFKNVEEDNIVEIKIQIQNLERVFCQNNIHCECINIIDSANIVLYEFELFNFNISFNKIKNLEKTLKMIMQGQDVVINFSQNIIGFTVAVPKKNRKIITIKDCLDKTDFVEKNSLIIPLGLDEYNKPICININKLPHLLIAGTTGSGKSVCINNIIASLLYNSDPYSLQFIMIDPKQVELVNYNKLNKSFMPINTITNIYKAATVLYNISYKMDSIYSMIQSKNCRNIEEYNAISQNKIPKTIIIIDEFADLMIKNKKEIEQVIQRIAQLGRACGIHLIIATQRPSREVITGLIKINIPARICFKVPSSVNSKIALDFTGAEKLLGNGDGLFLNSNGDEPVRFQSPFISTNEIENIINFTNN